MSQGSEDEGDDEGFLTMLRRERLAILFLLWLIPILYIFSGFVIDTPGEFSCISVDQKYATYEKTTSGDILYMQEERYDEYMRKEWIRSDNITSYKDIPEAERENLSEEGEEFLKEFPRIPELDPGIFNATEYRELSGRGKGVFERAIEKKIQGNHTEMREYEELTGEYVLYENTVYDCDMVDPPDRDTRGTD